VAELEGRPVKFPRSGNVDLPCQSAIFIIDNESGIQNPVGTAGEKLEAVYKVHVAPDLYQRNIQKSLDKAGIKMQRAVLDPIASSEVVLTEDEKEAGVVLIDIGGGTTKMSIFRDGVLCYTRSSVWCNVITHDIRSCSILYGRPSRYVQLGRRWHFPGREGGYIPGLSGGNQGNFVYQTGVVIQADG
jgi:cell division protein FtsA